MKYIESYRFYILFTLPACLFLGVFGASGSSSSSSGSGESGKINVRIDGDQFLLDKNVLKLMPYFRALLDPDIYLQSIPMYQNYRGDLTSFSVYAQRSPTVFLSVPTGVTANHVHFFYNELERIPVRTGITVDMVFNAIKNNPRVGPEHIKTMLRSAEKLLHVQSIPSAIDQLWTGMIKRSLVRPDGKIAKAFFSPNDRMLHVILGLINAEKKYIRISCYAMTNKEILCALARARMRGVRVEVVVDGIFAQDKDIEAMRNAGLYSYLWGRRWFGSEPKMHNKFYLFSDNINNQSILVTGSANCSWRAQNVNEENMVVTNSVRLVDQFSKRFDRQLRSRSFSQYVEPVDWDHVKQYAKRCTRARDLGLERFTRQAHLLWQALVRLYAVYQSLGLVDRFGLTDEIENEINKQQSILRQG